MHIYYYRDIKHSSVRNINYVHQHTYTLGIPYSRLRGKIFRLSKRIAVVRNIDFNQHIRQLMWFYNHNTSPRKEKKNLSFLRHSSVAQDGLLYVWYLHVCWAQVFLPVSTLIVWTKANGRMSTLDGGIDGSTESTVTGPISRRGDGIRTLILLWGSTCRVQAVCSESTTTDTIQVTFPSIHYTFFGIAEMW